jgi:hypothetical protein
MIQENMTLLKGTLQAFSEKNGGVLINDKWYSTSGIPATQLVGLKRKQVVAELSEDGRFVTKLEQDGNAPQQFKRSFGGRSEEDNRRIVRQATLNTATAIYDMALKTSAASFASATALSTAQLAEAIKTEVMRIATDLEAHVYR